MTTNAPLIDRFLEMMAAERGAARNTLLAYRTDLLAASKAIGGLEKADNHALEKLAGLWSQLSGSTVARKASALRGFSARTTPPHPFPAPPCNARCPKS